MAEIKNTLFFDKKILTLLTASLFLFGIMLLGNYFDQGYYLNFQWLTPSLLKTETLLILFYVGGIYLTKDFPYIALILKTIGMTSFLCLLLYIGNTAIFTTPFTTLHDSFINQSDLFIGFHLPPLLQWISHHPESDKVSWGIYFSLLFSAIFLPTALAIAKQQKAAYQYYFSFIISVVIAYAIYYLFPTTSPAAVYSHYYFNYAQGHLENYFQLEHNHQNYFFDMSSVVGFPSLHAAWITLIVCFLYPYRIVKYFALIYGISVIIAILFTGWHFFTDILGGIAIGILSIQLSKRFMRNHLKP